MINGTKKGVCEKDGQCGQEYCGMAYPNAIVISQNNQLADEGVYQYDFINLSNVPVTVNGMFLDRYFAGSRISPTIIAGSNIRWTPPMLAHERDTSSYSIVFLDTFYNTLTTIIPPYRNLIVMKKMMVKKPHNLR